MYNNFDNTCPKCGSYGNFRTETIAVAYSDGSSHLGTAECKNCGWIGDCTCRVRPPLLPQGLKKGNLLDRSELGEIFRTQREWQKYWKAMPSEERRVRIKQYPNFYDELLQQWLDNN